MAGSKIVNELNERFQNSSPEEVIGYFLKDFNGKTAFGTSLGAEDQVLTKMIADIDPGTFIFTLDTGRLFRETYDLISRTMKTYTVKINIFFPDAEKVEKMVNEFGINLFYNSVEKRELCCHIRKIEPSKRAFSGINAWICGIRRNQSVSRYTTQVVEWDNQNNLIKVNPVYKWTEEQVWEYINKYNIPYNPLHDIGYPSISCQPCTRAIEPGEDVRAGRWWWEEPEKKECGLHKYSRE
jgi:phosphoadenosine phosphosulfate reductase